MRSILELERHLETCAACRQRLADRETRSRAIREALPDYPAPPELRGQIERALGDCAQPARRMLTRSVPIAWAASILLSLGLGWSGGAIWEARVDRADAFAEELIAGHVRGMLASDRLTDVPSSDRHTIKPYFQGKLDYIPPVEDLGAEGFPLAGGRVDYLDHKPIAALIYRRREHLIHLYVRPVESAAPSPSRFESRGFQLIRWEKSGFVFWAISDLNGGELAKFAALLQS
jgi:anti-sigma factor RsiW